MPADWLLYEIPIRALASLEPRTVCRTDEYVPDISGKLSPLSKRLFYIDFQIKCHLEPKTEYIL